MNGWVNVCVHVVGWLLKAKWIHISCWQMCVVGRVFVLVPIVRCMLFNGLVTPSAASPSQRLVFLSCLLVYFNVYFSYILIMKVLMFLCACVCVWLGLCISLHDVERDIGMCGSLCVCVWSRTLHFSGTIIHFKLDVCLCVCVRAVYTHFDDISSVGVFF